MDNKLAIVTDSHHEISIIFKLLQNIAILQSKYFSGGTVRMHIKNPCKVFKTVISLLDIANNIEYMDIVCAIDDLKLYVKNSNIKFVGQCEVGGLGGIDIPFDSFSVRALKESFEKAFKRCNQFGNEIWYNNGKSLYFQIIENKGERYNFWFILCAKDKCNINKVLFKHEYALYSDDRNESDFKSYVIKSFQKYIAIDEVDNHLIFYSYLSARNEASHLLDFHVTDTRKFYDTLESRIIESLS